MERPAAGDQEVPGHVAADANITERGGVHGGAGWRRVGRADEGDVIEVEFAMKVRQRQAAPGYLRARPRDPPPRHVGRHAPARPPFGRSVRATSGNEEARQKKGERQKNKRRPLAAAMVWGKEKGSVNNMRGSVKKGRFN